MFGSLKNFYERNSLVDDLRIKLNRERESCRDCTTDGSHDQKKTGCRKRKLLNCMWFHISAMTEKIK